MGWELFIFDLCACIFGLPSGFEDLRQGRRLGEWQVGSDAIRDFLSDSFCDTVGHAWEVYELCFDFEARAFKFVFMDFKLFIVKLLISQ